MSTIQVNNLSYIHADHTPLFEGVSFSVDERQKTALVGPNGCGKSTLLQLLAGQAVPSSGALRVSGKHYFVPQHFGQYGSLSVSCALGIETKMGALHNILEGDLREENYEILADDWQVEERALAALESWGLHGVGLSQPLATLSGGEKTRVFLSGIAVHNPDIIFMDEPSNHLDMASRELLYNLIDTYPSAMVIVSHDRKLLNRIDKMLELGPKGITVFGGNYEFYKKQKQTALASLYQRFEDKQKSLKIAEKVAREAVRRKEKIAARGKSKMNNSGVPRIMVKKITDGAEASAKKLKEVHSGKKEEIAVELNDLRQKLPDENRIKIKLDDSRLQTGKTIVTAEAINFSYGDHALWPRPLDFRISSGQRIVLSGNNGSGKTTLIKLIMGILQPTVGTVSRCTDLQHLYVDQEYSLIQEPCSVLEQVENYNERKLPDHMLKTELSRFLFPAGTWDKPCGKLSGGEKMRLVLCCLMVKNAMPDLFILDEPTNNLDIQSLEIVTNALKEYRGTLLVVSHDEYFTREIGAQHVLSLVG